MATLTASDKINLYAQLGDLKDVDYRNSLAITALIELLIEKGVILRGDFTAKARSLAETDDILARRVFATER